MFRLLCVALAVATIGSAVGAPVQAQSNPANITLIKVVTSKDDVVVGLTPDEIAKFGAGASLEAVARELQKAGQLSVWQYASQRDSDGSIKMSPIRKIVILHAGTSRLEPYKSAQDVVAPKP